MGSDIKTLPQVVNVDICGLMRFVPKLSGGPFYMQYKNIVAGKTNRLGEGKRVFQQSRSSIEWRCEIA